MLNISDLQLAKLNKIKLTREIIDLLPKMDLHVHLPGTISPKTAWKLGIRNEFIVKINDKWHRGGRSLGMTNPHEHYTDIFRSIDELTFDCDDTPCNLVYNIVPNSFKSFDSIMATVQGHRHPPGGIQNEEDLKVVFREYLRDCVAQNIFYTEIQQNIRIAYHIYPDLSEDEARFKLYRLFSVMIKEFEECGVHLRFLHCFNKTQSAHLALSTRERALEAACWLQESREKCPGVFVGLEAAGHEKDENGWPVHLKEGYIAASNMGFGCEAHGGEGIGVAHMMDVARTLPVTRIAHGFQVIESMEAIEEIKSRNITLLMSPIINLCLGACIHHYANPGDDRPTHKTYIETLDDHPFFTLLRKHKMKITLCSDNPQMAGIPVNQLLYMLAGLKTDLNHIPDSWHIKNQQPLQFGELVECLVNSAEVAFCDQSIKDTYMERLMKVMKPFIQ